MRLSNGNFAFPPKKSLPLNSGSFPHGEIFLVRWRAFCAFINTSQLYIHLQAHVLRELLIGGVAISDSIGRMNMGMYVYVVYNGLQQRKDLINRADGCLADPATGKVLTDVLHVPGESATLTSEFEQDAFYEYGRRLEYNLAIGCAGRDWHDVLAAMVGFERNAEAGPTDGPFQEILHPHHAFTVHGPKTSKKLLADFDAWEEKAKRFSDAEFYLAYWWLRCCFGHGAQNGAVRMTRRMPQALAA